MFEWSKGSDLRAMIDAGVPHAVCDDWLEGWMHGFIQSRLKADNLRNVLDVGLGEGARPYLDSFRQQGAQVDSIAADRLTDPEALQSSAEKYDLVMLLSLEREACLQPLDFDDPLPFLEMLFSATKFLNQGGALVWSYLYCFPSDPDHVGELLEPAAIYQCFIRRNFPPLSASKRDLWGMRRVPIYHDTDTLFVRQKAILEHADRQERVTRICAGVHRYGAPCRIRYVPRGEPL